MNALTHARATKQAEHNLTMGDITHAVMLEMVPPPLRPEQVDPDETEIHLDTTMWELALAFGRVARRLNLLGGPQVEVS